MRRSRNRRSDKPKAERVDARRARGSRRLGDCRYGRFEWAAVFDAEGGGGGDGAQGVGRSTLPWRTPLATLGPSSCTGQPFTFPPPVDQNAATIWLDWCFARPCHRRPAMDQPSAIPRFSGLPRPTSSRLPVLRPSASQSQLRPPAPTAQLRKKPSAPVLQTKTTRASLARSTTPSTATASTSASRAAATRRVSGIPSAGPARASATHDAPVFKRPFARPPSRQTKAPFQTVTAPSINKEDDALGSLDGFRAASRASSRAGSRAGFYELDSESEIAVDVEAERGNAAKKKSRPSLSERTIESLSQLPSSPAVTKGRRRSSFFNADNSMPPPLRPASAMSSNGSRPTTSDGTSRSISATPKRFGTVGRLSMTAPRRSVSASVTTPATTPSKTVSIAHPGSTAKKLPLSQTQNVQNTAKPRPMFTSKSMVARTPKTRPSLAGAFGQAISPSGASVTASITPSPSRETLVKKTPVTSRKVSSSSIALREQIAKAKAGRQAESTDLSVHPSPKTESSSNALREHIAKAKEAARAKVNPSRTSTPPRDAIVPDPAEIAGFDFGLDDPFNQATKGSKSVLRRRLDSARADGRLNIAAMSLKEMPEDVLSMYKFDPNDATMAWGEIVDLTSLIAADNELETLPGTMFPDVDMEESLESDEAGPQFAAVQNIDLHGNALRELPVGLGCLTQLSKLNLVRRALQKDTIV
jgi:hypothetical protein